MLNCDWSVAGRLMRQMSLTRTHHATVVGPIRFSNRSNNCRVCKINGRQLSLVRTHHATIVFSSSLRPTDNKNRMVCAGLYTRHYLYAPGTCMQSVMKKEYYYYYYYYLCCQLIICAPQQNTQATLLYFLPHIIKKTAYQVKYLICRHHNCTTI